MCIFKNVHKFSSKLNSLITFHNKWLAGLLFLLFRLINNMLQRNMSAYVEVSRLCSRLNGTENSDIINIVINV